MLLQLSVDAWSKNPAICAYLYADSAVLVLLCNGALILFPFTELQSRLTVRVQQNLETIDIRASPRGMKDFCKCQNSVVWTTKQCFFTKEGIIWPEKDGYIPFGKWSNTNTEDTVLQPGHPGRKMEIKVQMLHPETLWTLWPINSLAGLSHFELSIQRSHLCFRMIVKLEHCCQKKRCYLYKTNNNSCDLIYAFIVGVLSCYFQNNQKTLRQNSKLCIKSLGCWEIIEPVGISWQE